MARTGVAIPLLLALFFFSGVSGLCFETIWQRQLTLVFGASAPATTAILTALFMGIGLGSYLGARLLERIKDARRAYIAVEIWIALWGLSVPLLLAFMEQIYVALFTATELGWWPSFGLRLLMVVAVIAPATLGMGFTLPLMNRLLVEQRATVGRAVALAYGLNTVGAVVGTLATGFILIDAFGLEHTLQLAAAIDGAIALVVLVSLRLGVLRPPGGAPALEPPPELDLDGRNRRHRRIMVLIYSGLGAVALGFELVWFRIIGLFMTNGTQSFALMLGVYLLGFSCGSTLLLPRLARRFRGATVLAISAFFSAVTALSAVQLVYYFGAWRNDVVTAALKQGARSTFQVFGVEFLMALLLMFLPTLFMGLAYPALCAALIRSPGETADRSGRYYFAGTIGSAVGALLVGVVVIPWLGLVGTVAFLAGLGILFGLVILGLSSSMASRTRWLLLAASVLALIGAVVFGSLGKPILLRPVVWSGGSWLEEQTTPRVESRVLSYASGVSATVVVRELKDYRVRRKYRTIAVDEQPVAGTGMGPKTDAKMLAHLPLLLHPSPRRALTVGFGSGGTSWSMTRHGIEVDCVEIEPEVVRTAPLFVEQNHGVVDVPGYRIIINDARDHLHLTGVRYDVISTDVTNIAYKQNGSLYTVEYFELMRDRLAAGGIASAWVPMSCISGAAFRTLLRTFARVFPYTSVWYLNNAETDFAIFIATPEPLRIDLDRVRHGFARPDIAADLEEIGVVDPLQLVHFLLLDTEGVRRYTGPGTVHTDNRPILEFDTSLSHYDKYRSFARNIRETMLHRPPDRRRFVVSRAPIDADRFERFGMASDLLTTVNGLLYRSSTERRTKQLATLSEAHMLATEAVTAAPELDSARERLEEVTSRLQRQGAGRP